MYEKIQSNRIETLRIQAIMKSYFNAAIHEEKNGFYPEFYLMPYR